MGSLITKKKKKESTYNVEHLGSVPGFDTVPGTIPIWMKFIF